jgi:hypothetical protein
VDIDAVRDAEKANEAEEDEEARAQVLQVRRLEGLHPADMRQSRLVISALPGGEANHKTQELKKKKKRKKKKRKIHMYEPWNIDG